MCKSGCRYKNSLPIAGLALFWALAPSGWAQRNYDNVDDILNGQRSLLRIDDLVLTAQLSQGNGLGYQVQLNTLDSKISSAASAVIPGIAGKKPGPTTVAHMFQNQASVLVISYSAGNTRYPILDVKSADVTVTRHCRST